MVGRLLLRVRYLLHRLAHPDGDAPLKIARKDIRRLTSRVAELTAFQLEATQVLHRADRTAAQLRLMTVLNRRQRREIAVLPEILNEARIAEHVRQAIDAAPMLTEPYEHIVVDRVLPDDVYELLMRTLPPVEFFDDRDPIKLNVTFPLEIGPTLSMRSWEYMDNVIARRIIRPSVLDKFDGPLRRHFELLFGSAFVEQAKALPHSVHGGRLMLRRPGYNLAPHRDPKRAMLTCLMYFAREGDNEAYGTQIFRVYQDKEASYKTTYYPGQEGLKCELVKVVPFRRNTMLVSLNSQGAHGAVIPADAPANLERYSYQFYVAPQREALARLIKLLQPEQRAMWRNKADIFPEYA